MYGKEYMGNNAYVIFQLKIRVKKKLFTSTDQHNICEFVSCSHQKFVADKFLGYAL